MEFDNFHIDEWGGRKVVAAAIVLLSALLVSWIFQLISFRQAGSRRLPPGPKGWPVLGSIPYLDALAHRSFYEFSKKYGPIIYLHLGLVPCLIISSAELAKEVLKTNDNVFASRPHTTVADFIVYGSLGMTFAPYGSYWRHIRKFSTAQLLTASKVAHFKGMLNQEILTTIHRVLEESQSGARTGVGVNITALSSGMARNIITQMMWSRRHANYSSECHADEWFQIRKTVEEVSVSSRIADFLPLKFFTVHLSGLGRKAKAVHHQLDTFLESILCEKEQGLSKETNLVVTDDDDFLTTMLKLMLQPENLYDLSREKIKAIILDLMFAASDTTTVTLDWTLAALMRYPHMMRKVQDELTKVVGEDRLVSESDIPQLKYLNAMLKEVLRFRPPAPLGIPHLSTTDCKVGGYDVPANTWLFVNQFAVHRDPTVWENPWEFSPDRFLQSNLDYKGQNFEYIPFSSGRRGCPGINLASTVLHTALAQFLHTVSWSLPDGQKPENVDLSEKPGLTISRPSPLLINAKPRLAHHVLYPATS